MLIKSRTAAALSGVLGLALLSGGSVAVASDLIGSRDIKDDSIRSRDIRDGAVHYRDLSDSVHARVNAPGPEGAPGASAYEVALANGFEGTRSEWLDSLVGPEGVQGPQGPAGNDATTTKIAFLGGRSCCDADQTTTAGDISDVAFTSEGSADTYNIGGGFDFSSGKFIAPVAGVYEIQTDISLRGPAGALYQFFIRTSRGDITEQIGNISPDGYAHVNMSATVNTANSGQAYWVIAYSPGELVIDGYRSSFSGHLVFEQGE